MRRLRAEMLTATSIVMPCRCHTASCASVWSSTQSVSGSIRPVDSAISRKSAGTSKPARRVLPPQQRLDAHDPVGLELELGLVVQHELVGADRVAELADQREPGRAEVRKVGGVLEDRLVRLLGRVHREVGPLEQLGDLGAVDRPERDADARLRAHGDAGDVDVGREHLQHPLEDRAGGRRVDTGQHEAELVAARGGRPCRPGATLPRCGPRCGRGSRRRCGVRACR